MKKDDYIVVAAVSGGPDSMALLAYLEQYQIPYVIAHVNYQKRESAFRDEAIVYEWAQQHHRNLWVLHPQKSVEGNFQAWARAVRYEFFLKVARIYGAKEIWLGQHMEDSIETWMLQLKRNGLPTHYGLQANTLYQGVHLVRPFLNPEFMSWTKKDFELFCQKQNIPYGIDESNLENAYERNKLRHQLIEPASKSLHQAWLDQMRQNNAHLINQRKEAYQLVEANNFSAFQNSSLGWLGLDIFLYPFTKQHSPRKELEDLLKKLSTGKKQTITKPFFGPLPKFHLDSPKLRSNVHPLSFSWNLQVVNNRLVIYEANPIPIYVHNLAHLQDLCQIGWHNDYFAFSTQGEKIESFYVTADDFPLLIRPFQSQDTLAMRFGHKKVGRFLRDRNIPAALRPLFPVIEAKSGPIFAARIGADKDHYTKLEEDRFYMIQLRPN